MRALLAILVLCGAAGCVEPFKGSHIEFSLAGVKPICKQVHDSGFTSAAVPLPACLDDDDTITHHLELWAVLHRSTLVRLKSFTIQAQLKPAELMQLEKDGTTLPPDNRPFRMDPTGYLNQFTPEKRQNFLDNAKNVVAITSYAPTRYESGKRLHPNYYVGNFQPFTVPHNGTYHGVVDGIHPLGNAAIGGAAFDVDVVLSDLDSLFVTVESAPVDRPKAGPSEYILLSGTATRIVRGAISVEATSPTDPDALGHFNVFTRLDERDYF